MSDERPESDVTEMLAMFRNAVPVRQDRTRLRRVLESDALLALAIDRADLSTKNLEGFMWAVADMIQAAEEIVNRPDPDAPIYSGPLEPDVA